MTSTHSVLAGRYRLQEPIGQGGMGRVWLGTDEVLGRRVAVKEIVAPAGFTEDEVRELSARALREARTAARLSHANVVGVYDVVVERGTPWIVMEYVESKSLQQIVKQQGPLDVPTVTRIGLGVLAALRTAHGNGVLHRDVKPGNVLIAAEDGRVVLSDFGLATAAGDPSVTRSGVLIGSPSYMAPERARDGDPGPEADLWSLGATLFYALEGHAPYERSSAVATLTALATEDPPPARHAGVLAPVIQGLLRRSPEDRLDAATVERMLRQAETPFPPGRAAVPPPPPPTRVAAPVPTRPAGPPAMVARRRRGLPLMLLLALVALAALVAWSLRTDSAPQPGPTSTVEPTAAQPAPTSEPPPAPSTTEPAAPPPTATAEALPEGWYRYTDETGFSFAVPSGWRIERTGTIVYFREPNGGRYLGIDQTDQPQPDPVADWEGKEAYRVARGDFPGYQRIRLEAVDYFQKAADWEFTYLTGGGRVHVLNRGFITSPTQAYGMWWSTPDGAWDDSLDALHLIQRTFTPAS
jgi:eukaryotic-like serine/threonine-protein kinase